jgi:hypothetical protein
MMSERERAAERALKLFEQLQSYEAETKGSSGCVVVSTEIGCELIFRSEVNGLARLSGLMRAGAEPIALLTCSRQGEISSRMFEERPPLDELMMARVQETFEAMHSARLLYPNLPPRE